MDVWGGAFNGQERRQTLFDQLLQELKIVTVVETGTFRGTTTDYMAKAGLPVFSCEFHPRYFYYSVLRLANIPNVRLERADSRCFLRELFDENRLPPGPALFYLDAHWERDLPLWEEVDQIFSRHPSPVIIVDDFRVPTDSGFAYDDYGRGKCLSVTNLHEAVTARPAMFFPRYASAHETGARRGCVVLAQGDLADYIRRKLPMLTELSLVDALILDRVAELHNDLNAVSEELQQTRAKSEAENAKRDAAAAREAATGLQNLVLRLHEELRLGRTERLGLQQQVAELQHSRWRRIGLLLGLARKATFER
jgi:hypothetical protein